MSGMVIFKVFVRSTPRCLYVLRYLDKNIEMINSLCAGVKIEKLNDDEIDEELIDMFQQKKITRLPAMLAPDGKVFIGIKQITDVFDKNLTAARNGERLNPVTGGIAGDGNTELGTNPDMADFWMREMYAGRDKHGRLIARKDKDEREDESGDLERRMADYNRNVPRHRRAGGGHERNIDIPERGRRATRVDDDYVDNVADEEDIEESPPRRANTRAPRTTNLAATGDVTGDDMDRRMLAAWIDKTPTEE